MRDWLRYSQSKREKENGKEAFRKGKKWKTKMKEIEKLKRKTEWESLREETIAEKEIERELARARESYIKKKFKASGVSNKEIEIKVWSDHCGATNTTSSHSR